MGIIERILALLGFGATPESLTRKAVVYAAKEDVMRAVEQYKKALGIDPLFIPAYDGLGKVYFRMGLREEADREFAIADGLEKLRDDPDNLEAGVKMGRAMMDKGMHRYIVSLLDPLLRKNPRHPDMLKVMGLSYKKLGNDKAARKLLKIGVDRWPRDPDFYQHLGSLELKSGNRDEGERLVNTARLMARIQSDPMDINSRMDLAKIFSSRELHNEAAEYLRQAVAIDKDMPDVWYALGECYQKAGLMPAAVDALKQTARQAPSDPRPHKLLARLHHVMGKPDEAKHEKELTVILEGGQSDGATPPQAARYVKYLLSIGLSDDAEAKLQEFLTRWPDSVDLKVILGRQQYKNGNYMESLDTLKQVAGARDDWAEPHIWMAMAYQRLGDAMSALAEGQLATRLAPKSHAAHKVLGDILREQKKFSMAENAYETAENLRAKKDH